VKSAGKIGGLVWLSESLEATAGGRDLDGLGEFGLDVFQGGFIDGAITQLLAPFVAFPAAQWLADEINLLALFDFFRVGIFGASEDRFLGEADFAQFLHHTIQLQRLDFGTIIEFGWHIVALTVVDIVAVFFGEWSRVTVVGAVFGLAHFLKVFGALALVVLDGEFVE